MAFSAGTCHDTDVSPSRVRACLSSWEFISCPSRAVSAFTTASLRRLFNQCHDLKCNSALKLREDWVFPSPGASFYSLYPLTWNWQRPPHRWWIQLPSSKLLGSSRNHIKYLGFLPLDTLWRRKASAFPYLSSHLLSLLPNIPGTDWNENPWRLLPSLLTSHLTSTSVTHPGQSNK